MLGIGVVMAGCVDICHVSRLAGHACTASAHEGTYIAKNEAWCTSGYTVEDGECGRRPSAEMQLGDIGKPMACRDTCQRRKDRSTGPKLCFETLQKAGGRKQQAEANAPPVQSTCIYPPALV
jgi:hypothetical protein